MATKQSSHIPLTLMSPLAPVAAKNVLFMDDALFAATGAKGDHTLSNPTYSLM
jgi:hypothetical protein